MSPACESRNQAELTDAEAAALKSMGLDVIRAMNVAMQSIRTATETHPNLVMQASIADFVANMAGGLAARAEFIATNAGCSRKDVVTICSGAFQHGRSLAWAQAEAAGDIIQANAPTTGAAQ